MLQIGNLEGYYHFQLNVSLYDTQNLRDDFNITYLSSRSIGFLSKVNKAPNLSKALKELDNVSMNSLFLENVVSYIP